MELIKRTDPAGVAALKRLLFAIALSALMHAWVASFGPERLRDSTALSANSSIVSPRIGMLTVSLQNSVPTPEARLGDVPGPGRQPAAINALVAPDARYYPVEELDVLPVPRQPIRMPQAVLSSGTVRLLTRIDASGRVMDVSVFDSGADAAQNAAAVDAMRRCTFFAARKSGRPVRSEVVIELPRIART